MFNFFRKVKTKLLKAFLVIEFYSYHNFSWADFVSTEGNINWLLIGIRFIIIFYNLKCFCLSLSLKKKGGNNKTKTKQKTKENKKTPTKQKQKHTPHNVFTKKLYHENPQGKKT